jgi:hypothetical protein
MEKKNRSKKAVDHASAGNEIAAWEEIAVGRFMPRRIRGSNRGRTLG